MNDVAMRRRIAALVIAALLAISGAALTSALLAEDARATVYSGGTVTDW
jgi:ABC-type cobalamin transport system permease subunit